MNKSQVGKGEKSDEISNNKTHQLKNCQVCNVCSSHHFFLL